MTAASPAAPVIEAPPPGGEPPWWRTRSRPTLVAAGLVVVVNVLVMTGVQLPRWLGPALGLWFVVALPVQLLFTSSIWGKGTAAERLGYSLTGVLLALMLGGVVVDLVLPLVGLDRPLDPIPVVLLVDAVIAALYLLRQRFPGDPSSPVRRSAIAAAARREDVGAVAGGALTVALAVLGANRLNNGAGDQVTLAALVLAVVTLGLLLVWRHAVRELTIQLTLYLLSVALLLMTSLRGWLVTGHDIQTEYQVFQLTKSHGRWQIATLHNAYDACLSITILPTELASIIHVDNPYIYKLVFQLLFALCPVLVFTIARRFWSVPTALLAAVYFISFPTFFTDMPFINRQEIALLFVCVAVLAITHESWSLPRRKLTLVVCCFGVEVSHYSSMYVFFGILAVAWLVQRVVLSLRSRAAAAGGRAAPPWATVARTVTIVPVLAAAVVTFSWGFLATQSAGAVITDARSSISGLFGHATAVRSNNVGYSLLFSGSPSSQQVLDDYARAVLTLRADSHRTTYIEPQSVAALYSVRALPQPLLPLTGVGRLLADLGVPVAGTNTVVRLGAADLEQLFVAIGLIALLVGRRYRRQVGREYWCLAAGSVVVLALVTILPNLSVDYGVLRVFQQALILLAPVIVIGSLVLFRPFGARWAPRIAAVVCLGVLVSTSGLLPQLLGGYPAQLNLNNSGIYYTSYYLHPQEAAGVEWLAQQNGVLPANIQATHESNRFLFTSPADVTGAQYVEDAFPTLLRTHAWVVLDYSILHTGVATVSYDGDIILYRYPVGILSANKNLVYDNGGIEVYR